MPSPPDLEALAARRARRRWLAKRRCLRALRATIAFMALVTPFLYFDSILYCRMPFGIGQSLPNWILLYECGMFLRNSYIFARYAWTTPLWAILPFILNIYFVIYYPPGPYGQISDKLYFDLFKQDRVQVIEMIESGILKSENCIFHLPQPYTYLAAQNGLVVYMTENAKTSVVFAVGFNLLSLDWGLCYVPDDNPEHWLWMRRLRDIEKIEKNWYMIYPRLGYLRAIMNWPVKEVPKETTPPLHPTPPPQRDRSTQRSQFNKFFHSFDRH